MYSNSEIFIKIIHFSDKFLTVKGFHNSQVDNLCVPTKTVSALFAASKMPKYDKYAWISQQV